MRRLLLVVLAAAALVAPATARADDAQFAEARAQVETARQLTQEAVDAARQGDRERAYQLARTAYLDHFEHAEVPLRLRDPNLVLDVEFAFAELRNGIRDGKSIGRLQDTQEKILLGLRDVDRTLADKGFAAPLLAFLFSFGILFREGLESVLLIAILLGSLASGRATGYRRPLGLGVLAALGATVLTWLLATLVLDIAPVQRELLEGVTAILAVVVLFLVSFWLVSQLEQRRRLEFTRARVASAIAAGSSLAFAGLGFTAVYREGFETVLFYQALAIFAEGLGLWVVLGAATAAVRARRRGLRGHRPRQEAAVQAAAGRRGLDAALALRRVRRERRPLAAGGRLDLRHADRRRLGAAADLPGRADRHPSDARGNPRAGRPAQRLRRGRRVRVRLEAPSPPHPGGGAGMRLRVGIDVGGTFTKAVAVCPSTRELRAHAAVPTTHAHEHGVAQGVADALRSLLGQVDRDAIELVAFSTTQAMNALLEGDVPRVGVVGLGQAPNLRPARKRTRVGTIGLAPQRKLETSHVFLDATFGLEQRTLDDVLLALAREGCRAVAVSAAFAVDDPASERLVCERAAACGLAVCAGHELSGAYGLETRTVSAAVNASILPVVERTTALVASALVEAGLDAPLLVLRGDGGAMSVNEFRRRPSFTIGSGPAAGVSAALHQLEIRDGIVVECGGTSSNVSVIKNGRPVLRTLRVMGRPTCVRSIDSWVVGAAGGSMARVGRRKLEDVGPRSAHLAGLPYACFASPEELADAELELRSPRDGDPADYAVVRAAGGTFALTATCAANVLGVADDAYAAGNRDAAVLAFAPLAERLRTSVEDAARKVLDGAARRIADAVAEAAKQHDLRDGRPARRARRVGRRARGAGGGAARSAAGADPASGGALLDRRRALAGAR